MSNVNIQQRKFVVKAGMTVDDVKNSKEATTLQKKYASAFDTDGQKGFSQKEADLFNATTFSEKADGSVIFWTRQKDGTKKGTKFDSNDNNIQFKTEDEVKPYTAIQSKNDNINIVTKKNSKANHDIECYRDCIKICEKNKSKLVEKLKKGTFSEQDKQYATEAKHPIAMGIGYAGMAICGIGMSAAILCFMEPHILVGGIAVAAVGTAIAGVAKGIIVNGDVKNTTDKDIQNYIKSEINKIDEEIAGYKEEIRKLEAE